MSAENPLEKFLAAVSASVADDTFVRLILSTPQPGAKRPERILCRLVDLRGQLHLSLTERFPTNDITRNLALDAAFAWLREALSGGFRSALLCTTRRDFQWSIRDDDTPRLVTHRPSIREAPPRSHDQPKRDVLDHSANAWLAPLGVCDARGKPRPAMADKLRQINRYLEILSHLAADCGWREGSTLNIADMGCGKGYLTFGAWHLFNRQLKISARVTGVELRPELATAADQLATRITNGALRFIAGDIATAPLPASLDALIALHACNTATDDAIRRGVALGARLIIVAPCCHKELRPQLRAPEVLAPVMRHGLMEERMAEWLTDGLRALYLEAAGYRVKILEFISTEHTAKNLMIAAVKSDSVPEGARHARERIHELKQFFGLEHHALDALLAPATPANA
jgi:SAM-dependent methyltransferase